MIYANVFKFCLEPLGACTLFYLPFRPQIIIIFCLGPNRSGWNRQVRLPACPPADPVPTLWRQSGTCKLSQAYHIHGISPRAHVFRPATQPAVLFHAPNVCSGCAELFVRHVPAPPGQSGSIEGAHPRFAVVWFAKTHADRQERVSVPNQRLQSAWQWWRWWGFFGNVQEGTCRCEDVPLHAECQVSPPWDRGSRAH